MIQKSNRETAWKELEKIMISGTPELVLKQRCPNCDSGLRVVFTAGPRTALIIRCTSCYSAITLDGGMSHPPWVEALGVNIVTVGAGPVEPKTA